MIVILGNRIPFEGPLQPLIATISVSLVGFGASRCGRARLLRDLSFKAASLASTTLASESSTNAQSCPALVLVTKGLLSLVGSAELRGIRLVLRFCSSCAVSTFITRGLMSPSFSELLEAVLLILDIDAAEDTLAKE
jgi:hypothetical protein